MNQNAIRRILQLKKRAWSLGLIVIAADLRQLAGLIDLSRKDLLQQTARILAGPLHLVIASIAQNAKMDSW